MCRFIGKPVVLLKVNLSFRQNDKKVTSKLRLYKPKSGREQKNPALAMTPYIILSSHTKIEDNVVDTQDKTSLSITDLK